MSPPQPQPLNDQQLLQIRDELERRLRRMDRSNGNGSNGDVREIDQSAVGRLSRIEALQNQGLTDRLKQRERTQRDEVLQALDRITEGCFGYCLGCQAPILFERLLVFPEARTCSECRNFV
ncbi:MAG: TraR/DksA family transcriptional regulator [Gemmatimonas sp.]|nr:TraR/DksA family transcriptional regulator [Gemmatimonas sp.]